MFPATSLSDFINVIVGKVLYIRLLIEINCTKLISPKSSRITCRRSTRWKEFNDLHFANNQVVRSPPLFKYTCWPIFRSTDPNDKLLL